MSRELIHQLSELMLTLSRDGGPVTPKTVVKAAASAVPHGRHAGLTLVRADRPPITLAASDDLASEVEALQYELDEGPALDAAMGPAVVSSDDIAADDRWSAFGPRCADAVGVRSMLSLRLPVGGVDHAAINYCSLDVAAFTDDDITVASVLVPLAALAVEADLREIDRANLMKALESSRQISTAVGILMSTHRLSHEQAFALLRRASMDLNAKVRNVAEEVNHTGALPLKRSTASEAPG